MTSKDIKPRFPIFKKSLSDWAYLDSAATTQKPESVIAAITNFYLNQNANIHRGLYDLSMLATKQYEEVRSKAKNFLGAGSRGEIAFTSGTTESINIIANSFKNNVLGEGDEIIISAMEHHSNLIPWQQACTKAKALLKIIPVSQTGDLIMTEFPKLLTSKTKLVALTHISNTLGTINEVQEIIELSHKKNVPVLLDAAQSVGHQPLDISKLNVDYMAFSAHKMFGPLGTGVLYAKANHQHLIQPLVFGGGAIKNVEFNETKLRDYPFCIEAGTPNIAGVIGLGAAIDFITDIGIENMSDQSLHLAISLREKLKSLPFVSVVGNPTHFSGIVPFIVNGIHAHDVASYLAHKKIAVRAGHHCTQPLHDHLGLPATVRASFSIYNSEDEVDLLIDALKSLNKFWE